MRPFTLLLILAISLLAAPSRSDAAKMNATAPVPMPRVVVVPDTLRQAAIHAKYRDGSFEIVVDTLEAFLKTHRIFRREDSLFIAKHLAVVYASNPASREKGKYHMRRLLESDPSANLMDMYVSDDLDRVWEKVRAEYFAARGGPPREKSPVRNETPAHKEYSTFKVAAWTGIGIAATGLVAYFLLGGSETGGNTFKVDARTQKP